MVHDKTHAVRLEKSLIEKAKVVAKARFQTMSGYLEQILTKQVEKDLLKIKPKGNE